jgi:hypothetical protein
MSVHVKNRKCRGEQSVQESSGLKAQQKEGLLVTGDIFLESQKESLMRVAMGLRLSHAGLFGGQKMLNGREYP